MAYFILRLANNTRKKLERLLQSARNKGDLAIAKKILTIFAVVEGHGYDLISEILKVSEESIRLWIRDFLLKGPEGLILLSAS